MANKHFFIRLLAVLVIAALLSSSVFILIEADHDCVEECCLICERLFACVQLMRSFITVIGLALLFGISALTLYLQLSRSEQLTERFSLISLKIKLLN